MKAAFYERTRSAKRILIIDPGVLGDTVHSLPALWDIRKSYPGAEIHTISSPVGAEVLRLAGCVNKSWILHQDPAKRSLSEQLKVIRKLSALRFEASINFSDNDRNILHSFLIGARDRLAFRSDHWHFWSPWIIHQWVWSKNRTLPVYEQRKASLQLAGIPVSPNPRFDVVPPTEAKAWAKEQIQGKMVHLSITASGPFKEWPMSRWIELTRRLTSLQIATVATSSGTIRELARLRELQHSIGSPLLRIWTDGVPLAKFAAMLQRCSLHIGTSSGATQLAMALGTPVLSIFRAGQDVDEWAPQGPMNRTLSRPCRCLLTRQKECEAKNSALCLGEIGPDEAVQEVLSLLQQLNPP